MKFFQILRGIVTHPLNRRSRVKALLRFLHWQLLSRLAGYPLVWPWIGEAHLVLERGMTGATGNLYNGLHEFEDMGFVLHFIRNNDLLVDVGANVGAYTILASVVGGARVIAFEPVPRTFEYLSRNVSVNDVARRVTIVQAAVGSSPGSVHISHSHDAANHVQWKPEENTVEVKLVTLDDFLIETPTLLKIDVEGFETEVINGAYRILRAPELKAIIIELNGLGNRYGFNDSEVHNTLIGCGFQSYRYDPFTRKMIFQPTWGTHNTLYVRGIDFVTNRVSSGRTFKVNARQL